MEGGGGDKVRASPARRYMPPCSPCDSAEHMRLVTTRSNCFGVSIELPIVSACDRMMSLRPPSYAGEGA